MAKFILLYRCLMLTSNVFDMLYDQAKALPDEQRLDYLLDNCDDTDEALQILEEIRTWEQIHEQRPRA